MVITSRENKIFKTAKLIKTSKGRNEKQLFMIEGMRRRKRSSGERTISTNRRGMFPDKFQQLKEQFIEDTLVSKQ